jgi:hypothetical protein
MSSQKKQEKEKRIFTMWGRPRIASRLRGEFVQQDSPL